MSDGRGKPRGQRRPGRRPSRDTDAMIRALLDRMPGELGTLPQETRRVVLTAIDLAATGDTAMLQDLLQAIDTVSSATGSSQPTYAADRLSFSDESAASLLRQLSSESAESEVSHLAHQALQVDPQSVDAMVVLADLESDPQARLRRYQQAIATAWDRDAELARCALPSLRLHMSDRLADDGAVSDAAEMLAPALQEDPDDEAQVRNQLASYYFQLGWFDELGNLLERYPDDDSGPLDFFRAILAYRVSGPSRRATALLTRAMDRHPGVAEHLCGRNRMPPAGTMLPFDQHHAAVVAEYLLPGLRDIEGLVPWIREQLDPLLLDGSDDEFAREYFDDPFEIALDLPTGKDVWWLCIEKDRQLGRHVATLLDDQALIHAAHFPQRPNTRALQQFVLSAIAQPILGEPRKPEKIGVPTKADVKALAKYLGTLGIATAQIAPPERERRRFRDYRKMLARQQLGEAQIDSSQTGQEHSADAIDDLPIDTEHWLFGLFRPPLWIHDRATPRRAYLQMVFDTGEGVVLKHHLSDDEPSADATAEVIKSAMRVPMVGQPRRTQKILLDPYLQTFGGPGGDLPARLGERIPETKFLFGPPSLKTFLDTVIADMLLQNGPTEQAIFECDELNEQQLAELYRVAANFYRGKPWKMVGGDRLFDITCDAWSPATRTGSVIGQLGQQLGIAIYDDPAAARRMIAAEDSGQDPWPGTSLVVHYGEAFDAIPADLWYAERNGWEVAGPEAHPFIARISDQRTFQTVRPEDVHLLIRLLPLVPRFLDHPRDAPFVAGKGRHAIELRWCE